ncbi:MAG: Inosine-5'-monophosphate dehydrogenase [Phycisphaerae bacterium]|nr:Inosine-5'-monophosphate dehydrogenase [Phycisphaerae bacterium]
MTTVGQIMTRHVITIAMDEPLSRAREILSDHGIRHLVVLDQGRVVGIVSDRDVLATLSPYAVSDLTARPQDLATLAKPVHQFMTRRPISVNSSTPVDEASRLMVEHTISSLLVVDDHRLVGIVTSKDLLRLSAGLAPADEESPDADADERPPPERDSEISASEPEGE